MPRSSSRVMPAQQLAPPAVFQASGGQVSYPNSPGRGMVWNTQRRSPVRRSKAMMSPGAAGGASDTRTDTISVSR